MADEHTTSELPSDIVTRIIASIPQPFDFAYSYVGQLPITEEDRPHNGELMRRYKIQPVPFAAGLLAQLTIVSYDPKRVLSVTINSSIHQHFLEIVRRYNIVPPILMKYVTCITAVPSKATLAYLLNIIEKTRLLREASDYGSIFAPEVFGPLLTKWKRERRGPFSEGSLKGNYDNPRVRQILPLLVEHDDMNQHIVRSWYVELLFIMPELHIWRVMITVDVTKLLPRLEELRQLAGRDPLYAGNLAVAEGLVANYNSA